jgi:hypothetical protein
VGVGGGKTMAGCGAAMAVVFACFLGEGGHHGFGAVTGSAVCACATERTHQQCESNAIVTLKHGLTINASDK